MIKSPVNKQAAIFLSRKPRVQTIAEGLDIFATKLCSPEVAQNVKEMISRNKLGDDVHIAITIKIRRDPRADGQFAITMDTKMGTELGNEGFFGLG